MVIMSLELCKKDLFYDDLEVSSKEELFSFIINELVKKERIENPERILEKMNNKENKVKTFLGSHFAIPHVKSRKVIENTLMFIRLKNSIKWNDENDKVKYIFVLLIKPNYEDLHIDILMSLSRNIIDKNTADLIKHSENIDEILKIINKIQ
jgi:putative PTS IIA-like nitrogen-regulatory protein ptsN